MSDDEMAAMLASQTAIMAALVEHLAKEHVIDKTALIDDLYCLLGRAGCEIRAEKLSGPIRHLLAILESQR